MKKEWIIWSLQGEGEQKVAFTRDKGMKLSNVKVWSFRKTPELMR